LNSLKTIIFIFSIVVLLSVECVYASTTDLFDKSVVTNECVTFIEKIKADYEYGWITVPRDYDFPEKHKINIFYYYKKMSRFENPVAFFNGGPQMSSHGVSVLFESKIIKFDIKEAIDFIYIDQRGTGCSQYEVLTGVSSDALNSYKWSTSLGVVRDAETIRKKLLGESRKWKIFGQSYGAYIVFRYLELFPQSILKAFTHGYALGTSDMDGSYYRILSQYEVTNKFISFMPDLKEKLETLNTYLSDSEKCFVTRDQSRACGYEILTPLVYMLGLRDKWLTLSSIIRDLVPNQNVDENALQRYISKSYLTGFPKLNSSYSFDHNFEQSNLTLNFAGMFDWDNTPFDEIKCDTIYKQLENNGIKKEALIFNECKPLLQFKYKDTVVSFLKPYLSGLGTRFVDPKIVKDHIVRFSIPVFSYAGGLDSFIPQYYFVKQKKYFASLIKHKFFKETGHDGFYLERQVYLDLTM